MLEAACFFGYRLPEVFAGYERTPQRRTGRVSDRSSPKAWATAAPLLLVRVLLGLRPASIGLSR